MGRIVLMLLAAGLCACAASEAPIRSPAYEAGFDDGCATASAEAAPIPRPAKRDETAFSKDADYRAGWISGHAACRMQGGPPRL